MVVEELKKQISQVSSVEDLDSIIKVAEYRKDNISQIASLSWRIGDNLQMLPIHQNRKLGNEIGTLVKVNKIKVKVDFNGKLWNVPKEMLQKVQK